MSAPVVHASSTSLEKKGLSKYVARMKSVLRRSGSKQFSMPPSTPPEVTTSALASTSEPAILPVHTSAPNNPPVNTIEPVTLSKETPAISQIMRSQIDADRARRIGERFRISIEPNEWTSSRAEKAVQRVEKPIRIRIHRMCHRCNFTFGSSRVCPACEHRICSRCSRYPPKNNPTEEIEAPPAQPAPLPARLPALADAAEVVMEVDEYFELRESVILTLPSRKGGQPLVRKRPMQRVRRTCHECASLFPGGSKVCLNCNHLRCADCPRDPAKKSKYPDGYPGDHFSSTSTSPIKYDCHICHKTYPPVPHPKSPEGIILGDTIEPLECTRCGHQRCRACKRTPPQRVEPAPDPEIVKSLEAKLAALNLPPVKS